MPPKIHRASRIGRGGRMFVLHRQGTVMAGLSLLIAEAESGGPSSVAEAARRGGWIHLSAVTGRGGRFAAACFPLVSRCYCTESRVYGIGFPRS